jgi:hypothetical protein
MEWIKCSDRMPEIGEEVLTLRYFYGSNKMLHKDKYEVQEWLGDSWTYYGLRDVFAPTHWMSLPHPPKDKE